MTDKRLKKVIDFIKEHLIEDVPTNSLAGGKIAGTEEAGDDPPVRKRKRKRYIYQKGLRKTWTPQDGRTS